MRSYDSLNRVGRLERYDNVAQYVYRMRDLKDLF